MIPPPSSRQTYSLDLGQVLPFFKNLVLESNQRVEERERESEWNLFWFKIPCPDRKQLESKEIGLCRVKETDQREERTRNRKEREREKLQGI